MLGSQSSAHSVTPHHGRRLVLGVLKFLNRGLTLSFPRLKLFKAHWDLLKTRPTFNMWLARPYPSGSLLDPSPNFCHLLPTELFLIPQMLLCVRAWACVCNFLTFFFFCLKHSSLPLHKSSPTSQGYSFNLAFAFLSCFCALSLCFPLREHLPRHIAHVYLLVSYQIVIKSDIFLVIPDHPMSGT